MIPRAIILLLAFVGVAQGQALPKESVPVRLGPQFLFAWKLHEQETVLRAIDNIRDKPGVAEERWKNPRVKLGQWSVHWGYRLMREKIARIEERMKVGYKFYSFSPLREFPADANGDAWEPVRAVASALPFLPKDGSGWAPAAPLPVSFHRWVLIQPFEFDSFAHGLKARYRLGRAAGYQPWTVVRLSIAEEPFVGLAVSKNRYCRTEDQDTDDVDAAREYCKDANYRAIALFNKHFLNAKAIYPGGKTW